MNFCRLRRSSFNCSVGENSAGGMLNACVKCRNWCGQARKRSFVADKNPNRERLGFHYWWWDGTPHQTTIESTESKRCGLLRTLANRIESLSVRTSAVDDQAGFSPWLVVEVRPQPHLLFGTSSIPETGTEPASCTVANNTPICTHS